MSYSLVFIGPPGGGKTTIGTRYSTRFGLDFRDTDHDIEHREGMSVADIFVTHGEEYFRHREHDAVMAALAEHRGILALGGGALMHSQTRAALHEHPVIFLDVGLATAAKRVGMNQQRPLLLGNVRAQLKKLMNDRRPHYLEVADLVIMTDELAPDDIVDTIGSWQEER